jgi:RNA polymerase sigma factor (sigma-70 family)
MTMMEFIVIASSIRSTRYRYENSTSREMRRALVRMWRKRNIEVRTSGPLLSCRTSRNRDRWCILARPKRLRDASGTSRSGAHGAPRPSMPPPSDILLEHLALVERIVSTVCRKRGMDGHQIEEFSAFVKLRLVENDYAIIRAFRERSSFGTYMTTVVSRLLNDHRNHEWGKWRDSAEAKRQGNLAIDLERLIVRDSHSLDEALAILAPKYLGLTRETLEEIATRFPKRHRRRTVSLQEQPESKAVTEPHDPVTHTELAKSISQVVNRFVQSLSKEDQVLIQLRFGCDMPVPQIARTLHEDTQSLYRRLRTHMGSLRVALEAAGVSAQDVARLIGSDDAVLDFQLKSGGGRPSNGGGAAPEEDV